MKKNVASQKIGAQMISATDGSAFTGSVTVYVTLDAGTQAVGSVGSGACTHEGNGYHTYAPAQAETNGDLVAFTFTGTGAIPVTIQIFTSFPQTGDSYAEVTNVTYGLSAIETLVDGLESSLAAGVTVTTNNDKTGYALSTAGVNAVADQVWDETLSGHLTAGSTGEALNAAGAAGDPWTTSLPGAYGAGSAGYIIGTNVDATISSRATQTSVDTIDDYVDTEVATILAAVDTEVAAIKAKTDLIPASPAATGDIPSAATIADAVWDEATLGHTTAGTFGEQVKTDIDAILDDTGTSGVIVATNNDKTGYAIANAGISAASFAAGAIDSAAIAADAITDSELAQSAAQEIADEILNRNLAGGGSGNTRNVRNALRALRNKQAIAAGTLTVYQEDDTTSAWTATVATTAGDPISSIDPA